MLYPHTPSTTHTEWPFTMLQNRTLWVCRHKHGVSSSANVRSPCVYTRNLRSSAEDLSERCISKQSKLAVGTPMLNISKYYFRIALFDANFPHMRTTHRCVCSHKYQQISNEQNSTSGNAAPACYTVNSASGVLSGAFS